MKNAILAFCLIVQKKINQAKGQKKKKDPEADYWLP
jgi:hypothetical protein